MEPLHPTSETENELRAGLAYLKNSREFQLGSRLRQSVLFKLTRRWRLRDRLVKVSILGEHAPLAHGSQVCLAGVWSDDYPLGMPLELLDRTPAKWQFQPMAQAPFGSSMATVQSDTLYLFSRDEKLRLDFWADQNSGLILVESAAGQRQVDLFTGQAGMISVYPNRKGVEVVWVESESDGIQPNSFQRHGEQVDPSSPSRVTRMAGLPGRDDFTPSDLAWLEQQRRDPRPLSIGHPEWRGILSASRQLFDNVYTIPDLLERSRATYYARLILESGAPSLTIQGFPLSYTHLVKALRRIAPALPIFVIYHGNYLHVREDYDWNSLKTIRALHDAGDIVRVGFVKFGMAEVMAAAGMRSSFIMNLVRRIPDRPSETLPGKRHIGIWGQPDWSWKKPPYAMLAALKLIPDVHAQVYNVSPRAQEFGNFLDLPADYILDGVPQEQVPATMARMHLNLYVTLTECAPMMPLESLSMGAPCLLGPNSPYFLDNVYLQQRLVVGYPEQAEAIAISARRALEERDEIIAEYIKYAPGYNQRALQVLAGFLANEHG